MLEVICGLFFGATLIAALVYVIRRAWEYYRALPDFYTALQQEGAMGAAAALCSL